MIVGELKRDLAQDFTPSRVSVHIDSSNVQPDDSTNTHPEAQSDSSPSNQLQLADSGNPNNLSNE